MEFCQFGFALAACVISRWRMRDIKERKKRGRSIAERPRKEREMVVECHAHRPLTFQINT